MNKQAPKPNAQESVKSLIDTIVMRTLLRARDGKLRRGEADSFQRVMAAVEAWSNISQRCEIIENALEIKRLAGEVLDQGNRLATDLREQTKAIIRDAVAEGVKAADAAHAERADAAPSGPRRAAATPPLTVNGKRRRSK